MEEKRCPRCNERKPLSTFVRLREGYASICKPCKRKESAKWYAKNKGRQVANARRNAARYQKQYESWKDTLSCQLCGESFSKCLEFHHLNREKDFNVSDYRNRSIRQLKEELSKCVVLCSNCHRKVHYEAITLPPGLPTCNFAPEARVD